MKSGATSNDDVGSLIMSYWHGIAYQSGVIFILGHFRNVVDLWDDKQS